MYKRDWEEGVEFIILQGRDVGELTQLLIEEGGMDMRLTAKICRVLVALFVVFLAGYFLSYSNLAQHVKGMGKRTSKVTVSYLGSVPMEASLVDLGLKKDKTTIELKERWLDSQTDPHAYDRIAVSPNGKFHVRKTFPAGEKHEGGVIATFIDSNGAEIWSSEVGEDILVSNNGKNIVAFSSAFGTGNLTLYDVRGSTEPIAVIANYGVNTFTENGDYFMSSGSKIALYTADGHLLWEKDSGARGVGRVAISSNANSIVVSSKMLLEESEAKTTVKRPVDAEPRKAISPEQVGASKEKTERKKTPVTEKDEEEGQSKSEQSISQKRVRKTYLNFFKGDGTLITRVSVPYRMAQNLVISGDGRYTAMSCDSTLLFFQNDTGALLWKYEFPNAYWFVISIDISDRYDLIALGINSNLGDRLSPRYLYLVNKTGEKIADFKLENPLIPQISPIVTFSGDEQYVLAGTRRNKYLFRIQK